MVVCRTVVIRGGFSRCRLLLCSPPNDQTVLLKRGERGARQEALQERRMSEGMVTAEG